jgi:predicted transcriptional regulator
MGLTAEIVSAHLSNNDVSVAHRTADINTAAPIKPAGVVRPVAATVARLPSLNCKSMDLI